MYSYKTGLGQVWVGSKLPPNSGSNIIWLRPSDDHKVLWEIRTYNIYKERWEVLTSAALTAEGLLILIRDLEKRCKSLEELKVVLYDTIQNLTPEEQKIARQNIGAISLEDLPPQVEIVQEVGSSTTAVMSQNAVTEELSKKASVESVTESISTHNTSSTSHADIRNLLNTCVGLPTYDSSSYKITFTTLAGAFVEIDLPIEQLALRYNAETESIEFDNADGTTTSIPVSTFVKEYVGSIGDRIQISIDENNVIHATVLKNSIDWDCLSVDLQARINDHVTSVDFATKVVRTDIAQSLSLAAQNQALENIGADLMVIDLVNGQAVLTEEQEARLLSSKGVILRGTTASPEVLSHIFHSDIQTGDVVGFYSFRKNDYCLTCQYTKSTKTFKVIGNTALRDNSAVVFNLEQSLTASQQEQALANLGMKVYVTDSTFLGSTLSAEEIEEVYVSKAILFTDTGDLFLFGSADNNRISFLRPINEYYIGAITVAKSSGIVSGIGARAYQDKNALHFTAQNPALTSAQQDVALSNIGLDFVHIDYSLLGTTVTDAQNTAIVNSKGIILTNIPNSYKGPLVFIRGRFESNGISFFAQDTQALVRLININVSTKVLSRVEVIDLHFDSIRYNITQTLTDTQKQQARSNINAVGSSMIKGVEIVYGTAPMQQDNILYIELKETT